MWYSIVDTSICTTSTMTYSDLYHSTEILLDLCANTDQVADSFFSPAGFNRGRVRGAIKLVLQSKQCRKR